MTLRLNTKLTSDSEIQRKMDVTLNDFKWGIKIDRRFRDSKIENDIGNRFNDSYN